MKRNRRLFSRDRNGRRIVRSSLAGLAITPHRATITERSARNADRRSQLHHCLVKQRRPLLRFFQQIVGNLLKPSIVFHTIKKAADNALHITVKHRMHLIAGDTCNGRRRIRADADIRSQSLIVDRHGFQAFGVHLPGGSMQVTGALIVSQSLPVLQNLFKIGQGKRLEVGEPSNKAIIRWQHGCDPRLLQHDLRDPDAIGITAATEGQIPLVLSIPVDKGGAESLSFQ